MSEGFDIEGNRWKPVQLMLLTAIAATIACILILAAVPPVSRDALTHHLAVPKLWIQNGGMVELPHLYFSYFPMNLDLLYAIPLLWGNDILPKYIHFGFALLTALLIYHHLRRELDRSFSLFGALLFLALPVIVKLSVTVYVDLGLIFFSTSSLLLLIRWMHRHHHTGTLLLAGLCCGLAIGAKINGLLCLFLLTPLVPLIYLRSAQRSRFFQFKSIGNMFLFLIMALLVFSPWALRNYRWTGNPIHPFKSEWFINRSITETAPPTRVSSAEQPHRSNHRKVSRLTHRDFFAIRRVVYGETWWQTLLIPVRIFFEGQDDNPRLFDGRLTPLLFILPWFALWGTFGARNRQMKLERAALALFSLLYLLMAFLQTDMRIRYIGPILPPLVLLSVYGLHHLYENWRPCIARCAFC
jgi:4-amino-4-deoxy-L-arabinose transferase-like glycosyltransferase